MFGIGGCEEVKNFIFGAQRSKKRKHQMKGCVAEQKVSDWQMNAWTLQICDIVRDWWRMDGGGASIKNFLY